MGTEMKVPQVQYRCQDRTYCRHVCEQGIRRGRLDVVQPENTAFMPRGTECVIADDVYQCLDYH